ncbi:PD-(D/E)XK nuclease family protein [Iamia sp. SCSIO 61187]|uniref:PD-(D/E)XK nuclease family protein n=1 Tax=Iamia sp. SCSIO 61187 TaxID=2722752 RepID=UPI001C625DFD|nr:PD-(D/E)XK nuclease family protein [Iamia sp. SCSIO 61187]QYG91430.1 PD-(D/E)XK nuclease family protein [Iamia sp. SCSIO 61187]
MPSITVTPVPYGRGALVALRDAVADAKAGDPLAPVTVVVPSNHVGVTARRLLASDVLGPVTRAGRGVAAVDFLTVFRLAELLGAATIAATGRRPVSIPSLSAAVRQVLGTDPGLFAPVADHPATEAALVASYRELRDLPDAALSSIARTGPRAAEVVRVHRAARQVLAAHWSDEEDLMAAAADRVGGDPGAAEALGPVVLHLPQLLTLHAAALVRTVAERQQVRVLAGTTGDPRADADVVTTLARLGVPVPAPDGLPRAGVGIVGPTVAPDRTQVASASDADDEVRHAVRRVVAAARAGTPLDRIAVLHPTADPYARLLHEHLAAAGVAVNGPSPVPLASRAAGRTLIGLLALPEQGWRRQAVLDWLGTAPLRFEGRPVPVAAWERLSREAGVVAGRDQWDARLLAEAARRDERAEQAVADDDAAAAARNRRRADHARSLRAFVTGLADDLERAGRRPRTWSQHARWARALLDRLLGPAAQREDWPGDEVERRAAERVELAIDRLAVLDEVEGPVGLDVVVRTLEVELESDTGRVGRFGDGVLVGPLTMGVGLDLDLVVVVGLAEGLAPRPPRDDSLLPDTERRAVDGLLPLRRDGVARQHRHLLAATAAADRQVLCFPRGDLRGGRDRVPSRWLLDLAGHLSGGRLWGDDLPALDVPWLEHIHSFDHAVRTFDQPATPQEHRLRSLLAAGAGPRALGPATALGDPVIARGAELIAGRASSRLTRFDGNLGGLPVASPADPESGRVASATGLERWARCPFDYFVRSVLGIREVENPEDSLSISALDRGSLVHKALEDFLLEVLARPERARPGPTDPWTAADRLRLREIGAALCAEYEAVGLTGRALFWGRDRARILADLDATLTFDEEVRRLNGGRHLHAELGFGLGDEDLPPVALPLPDGRAVRFRGQIDRIDRTEAGGLVVADYKTGGTSAYQGLSERNPDQGGTHLQLAVYGAAARAAVGDPEAEVRSEYWFVSSKGRFSTKGYVLTPEISERISETLGLIVEGIEAGLFPAHPTDHQGQPWNPCWSCDPDFLGVADLRRAWEAKGADPAMAGYLALIDPDRRSEPDPDEVDPADVGAGPPDAGAAAASARARITEGAG